MRRSYATVALWATLALVASSAFEASFAGATATPEKTVPQGQDPPGADDGEQQMLPPAEHTEVIPPPLRRFTPMLRTQMPDTKRK